MNLGILLPLGSSLEDMRRHGQDVRFVHQYLRYYSSKFDKIYLFSYKKEAYSGLPSNCKLVCPKKKIHRYLYGLVLPFLNSNEYRDCDVFRCFHPSATVPAIAGKLFWGKKFVFNYNYDYSAWARVEGKAFLEPFIKLLAWIAFKSCNHVFVADEKMAAYVGKLLSKKNITIVRNGADVNLFKPREKKPSKIKVVLSVGRLEPQKNYLQLIEAIAFLKSRPKLIIVGKGSLKSTIEAEAKKRKVELKIIPVVPNDQLPSIYNQADIYVQPSLMEAPVKTLLEAMSCGLACVATNVPGIKDVIIDGENGLLAELTAKDIAQKIGKLLSDIKLTRKLGKNARDLILEKYNLEKMLNIEYGILSGI